MNLYKAVKSILNLYTNDSCKIDPAIAQKRQYDSTMMTAFEIINIYPNPTSNLLNIQFSSYGNCTNIDIDIIDVWGQHIKKLELINNSNGLQNRVIELEYLDAGIYFLKFSCNEINTDYVKVIIF